jgi:peptidoglycan hydrolase-like protein with peptidoglycan-binding domain
MLLAEANNGADGASNSIKIDMKITIVMLVLIACAEAIRADQAVSDAQQALKDLGFYYGEVTGEKNADTTAAVRRYQIRNGLQITGELDDQTLRSLASAPSNASPPPVTSATIAPANTPPARAEQSAPETEPSGPSQVQPFTAPPQDRSASGGYPPDAVPDAPTGAPRPGGLFADTPYDGASPEAQRNILVAAQKALAAHGFYHGNFDGAYNAAMQFSLRAYQSRFRLPVTGRLDLETLAALELLPGAKAPIYRPRRRLVPRMRGEWIRP